MFRKSITLTAFAASSTILYKKRERLFATKDNFQKTWNMPRLFNFMNPSMLAMCQGGIDFQHPSVTTLNNTPIIKHLLSVLRDKKTKTAEYRRYSDRIMRLLCEEAIASQLDKPERRLSPTGEYYDHYSMKHAEEDYCCVSIIRAGDSMIGEIFDLMPNITCGKVLVQRDEETAEPIFFY